MASELSFRSGFPLSLPFAHVKGRTSRWSSALLLLFLVTACAPSRSAPVRPAPRPERIETTGAVIGREVVPVSARILGTANYDLPLVANSWVELELEFLLNQRRSVVRNWMDRADFYADFVEEIFRQEGIPTDLVHLGMIESGFIPAARSPAGAVGIWQFMPATSRDVGLRVDSFVDERMDPVRSTRAAARHLRTLYRIHGDWALAAAAYNAGSGRISRGLERFGARDFWELAQRGDLAAETQQYVPRLFAMTIIGRDRERFGFAPPPPSTTFAFDSVHVDHSVPLAELAEIGGLEQRVLTEMNPHLIQGVTPTNEYWVWVPAGSGPAVQRAFIAAEFRRTESAGYTVRWGDTLGGIAQLSGESVARIRELNPNVDFERLREGAQIQLPRAAADRLNARPYEVPEENRPSVAGVAPPPPPEPLVHSVERGETLSGIAQRYGVTLSDLRTENAISGSVIVPGQRLRIPGATAPARTTAPATRPADAAPAPVASRSTTSDTGAAAQEHQVRAGDTLSGIARQYGTSVGELQRINGIEGSVIVPGQRLRLSAPATVAAPVAEETHQVQPGETLSGIARRYGSTVAQLQELNGITGSVIVPGQRLRVQRGSGSAAAQPEEVTHTVTAGETLWGIAQRYHSTIEAIERANGLGSRPIIPGQKLVIPR